MTYVHGFLSTYVKVCMCRLCIFCKNTHVIKIAVFVKKYSAINQCFKKVCIKKVHVMKTYSEYDTIPRACLYDPVNLPK